MPSEPGTPSPWTDLDRPPLSALRLRRALVGTGGWRRIEVVPLTRSTNADVAAAARAGEPAGLVVVAEAQDTGRGRLDRRWDAPPRSSVLLSVLLRPTAPVASWTLLPFVVGVAAVEALRAVSELDATLKWPNDLMHGDRKLGGILVEVVDGSAVVGIGVNVSMRADELPVDTATSVAIAGGVADREVLTKELLRALRRRYDGWNGAAGAATAILPAYREVCATVGRDVRVDLPNGGAFAGRAEGVDDCGRLVVNSGGLRREFSAGDVVHVRPRD